MAELSFKRTFTGGGLFRNEYLAPSPDGNGSYQIRGISGAGYTVVHTATDGTVTRLPQARRLHDAKRIAQRHADQAAD